MSPLPARGTLAVGEPEALLRQVYEAWQADWAQWQVDRAELGVTQAALTSTQAELQEAGGQIAHLTARVAELEKPAKTPENSSTPPSKAPKGNKNACSGAPARASRRRPRRCGSGCGPAA